jgi:hypothetical protein
MYNLGGQAMTIKMNYYTLSQLNNRIVRLQSEDPMLSILLSDKIERILKLNHIRIEEGHKKIQALIDKHVMKDGVGVPLTKGNSFAFKSESDREAYNEASEKLSKLQFDITL